MLCYYQCTAIQSWCTWKFCQVFFFLFFFFVAVLLYECPLMKWKLKKSNLYVNLFYANEWKEMQYQTFINKDRSICATYCSSPSHVCWCSTCNYIVLLILLDQSFDLTERLRMPFLVFQVAWLAGLCHFVFSPPPKKKQKKKKPSEKRR